MRSYLSKSSANFLKSMGINLVIFFIAALLGSTGLFVFLKHSVDKNMYMDYPNAEAVFVQALAYDGRLTNINYFLHSTDLSDYAAILFYASLLAFATYRVVKAIRKRSHKGLLKIFLLLGFVGITVSNIDFNSRANYLMWQDSAIYADKIAREEGFEDDENYKKNLRSSRQLTLSLEFLSSMISSFASSASSHSELESDER